ncbi:MAG TPA: class III extradiol ring-cleavage dioxygenase [Kofleriaceae bacterium]
MSERSSEGMTRREAIAAGAAVAGAAAIGGGVLGAAGCESSDDSRAAKSATRMPAVYLPHGGGPWPWIDGMFPKTEAAPLMAYLESLPGLPKTPPKAILVISAHWEEAVPTVLTAEHPPMLYDYYGFPEETYHITWPAPGAPALAARVRELLDRAGLPNAADDKRGFDHGTFVPLKVAYPDAQIPTVQLSLIKGLDPEKHIALGRALAPLRDEGVFIVGSGMSYHNMRGFFDKSSAPFAAMFDEWLRDAATKSPAERNAALADWAKAPAARACHPREEHLIPLMVIAGAAGDDKGIAAFSGTQGGKLVSAFHYG